ncbi:nucleotidyl transferase AbiEii/AbiGii toxin family protein [Treponema socranskii]
MNSEKNSTSYSDYYEENLYGLQNGVLNIVKNLDVPFYLTGGTALSRGYYHHRYSDDLDFFCKLRRCICCTYRVSSCRFEKKRLYMGQRNRFY